MALLSDAVGDVSSESVASLSAPDLLGMAQRLCEELQRDTDLAGLAGVDGFNEWVNTFARELKERRRRRSTDKPLSLGRISTGTQPPSVPVQLAVVAGGVLVVVAAAAAAGPGPGLPISLDANHLLELGGIESFLSLGPQSTVGTGSSLATPGTACLRRKEPVACPPRPHGVQKDACDNSGTARAAGNPDGRRRRQNVLFKREPAACIGGAAQAMEAKKELKSVGPAARTVEQAEFDDNFAKQTARQRVTCNLYLLSAIYNAAILPWRYAFDDTSHAAVVVLDAVSDFFILLHIVQRCRTPCQVKGLWVQGNLTIWMEYVRGLFFLDFFAFLPGQLAYAVGLVSWYHPMLRVNKLLSVLAVPAYSTLAVSDALHHFQIRFLRSGVAFALGLHALAAVFQGMMLSTNARDNRNFVKEEMHEESMDTFHRYVFGVWYCLTASCGYNSLMPQLDVHVVFGIAVSILGLAVYATTIASVTSLLESSNKQQMLFRDKMDKVNSIMAYRGMPKAFCKEVHAYYKHVFQMNSKSVGSQEDVFEDLPEALVNEITFALNFNLVKSIPLFAAIDNEDFVVEIVTSLRMEVAFPGCLVVRQGTEGSEMYFVMRGELSVEVQDDHGLNIVHTLREGSFFGEMSLLFGSVRSASVRATSYSTLYVLDGDVFKQVALSYRECLQGIIQTAQERLTAAQKPAPPASSDSSGSEDGSVAPTESLAFSRHETATYLDTPQSQFFCGQGFSSGFGQAPPLPITPSTVGLVRSRRQSAAAACDFSGNLQRAGLARDYQAYSSPRLKALRPSRRISLTS
eukprot:gene13035-20106_t